MVSVLPSLINLSKAPAGAERILINYIKYKSLIIKAGFEAIIVKAGFRTPIIGAGFWCGSLRSSLARGVPLRGGDGT